MKLGAAGRLKSRAPKGESGSVPLTVKVLPEPLRSDLASLHSKAIGRARQTDSQVCLSERPMQGAPSLRERSNP